ncbi:MAG: hypothetical protein ACE5GE_05050 [Phycisphaerae bacterium]
MLLAGLGSLALPVLCLQADGPDDMHLAPSERPAQYRGVAIQVHGRDDAVGVFGRLIEEVADLGADTVLLSADGYQDDIDSVIISHDRAVTPPDEQWLELFAIAKRRGLGVVLMPKVLLADPREGAWRGKIAPVSWKAWFEQYTALVMRFARLAQRGQVDVLVVGSELVSAEKHTAFWRELIRQVRSVYAGKLAYSANWDHYKGIRFWSDLDLIGMTTYYNLNRSKKPNPSAEQLEKAWEPIRERILKWQARVDRPLLFTEVGWCSQEGCSTVPWNYYHSDQATPAGHAEQAANYEAFIKAWSGQPQVAGLIFWEWTPSPGGADDHHYTPRNKPAQAVLQSFFGGDAMRHSMPSTTAPLAGQGSD